jgi:outer membrane protein OmpA-like peptidoglycan-associated protein
VTRQFPHDIQAFSKGLAAAALALLVFTDAGLAQQGQRIVRGEVYQPGIWVDPDGCEHWVMDDGAEGYMTPHVTRQGIPVCREANLCGTVNTDQYFATDSARLGHAARQNLANFFASTGAVSYTIIGHTDSRASDAYNMDLSLRRANAVASVARSTGARIADVRGMGERAPKASNNTAEGMAANRRVEILCWR